MKREGHSDLDRLVVPGDSNKKIQFDFKVKNYNNKVYYHSNNSWMSTAFASLYRWDVQKDFNIILSELSSLEKNPVHVWKVSIRGSWKGIRMQKTMSEF